ncbi:MAG: hypothetical protein MUF22_02450 [Chitinispirillaceae bacterium]|jgi:hypothetical protein|nr:hypothetical protein [Chitinispirillaceae bacterium]
MFNKVLIMIFAAALAVCGATKTRPASGGEPRADSVVYDKPTEWQVFSVGGAVRAFAVSDGLIWMATDENVASVTMKNTGLKRYKKLGTADAGGITCIAAAPGGAIWFGGKNGAVLKTGETFSNFSADNGLSDNTVTAIAVAGDAVWIGTENGLNRYQAGVWKIFSAKDGLVSNRITVLVVDGKGALWCGTDKGISVFDQAKWTTHNMKNNMSWNDIRAIGIDTRKNIVWAAVGEKDVNSWDGKAWNVFMDIQAGINSIMTDTQGRVWFGSDTGPVKFNGDEWISDPAKLGIPGGRISQTWRDPTGNLWFATENGVVVLANPYPY